jgi:hypothetical protein
VLKTKLQKVELASPYSETRRSNLGVVSLLKIHQVKKKRASEQFSEFIFWIWMLNRWWCWMDLGESSTIVLFVVKRLSVCWGQEATVIHAYCIGSPTEYGMSGRKKNHDREDVFWYGTATTQAVEVACTHWNLRSATGKWCRTSWHERRAGDPTSGHRGAPRTRCTMIDTLT